ncbi:hypothetical protein AB3S75_031735 [Citrus x aurantiifolia]
MGGILSNIFGAGGSDGQDSPHSESATNVMSFHSSARWQLHFDSCKTSSQLMVIDFAASWCGPCKIMEPELRKMASTYSDVQFVKIDVDELSDVAQEFQVQAMPTFVLVKGGKEVEREIGARKDELLKKIEKHRAQQ